MSNGVVVVTFNFPGLLAAITGDTRPKAWHEIEGPDSGVGLDYWYTHYKYGDVYINVDQGMMKVSVCDSDEVLYEGMVIEDERFKQFVTST